MTRSTRSSIIAASVVLLTACGTPADAPTGSAGAGVTSSGVSAPTPSTSPSGGPASPTEAPSAPDSSFTSWPMTVSFDTDPATSYVSDVAAWSGGFVAIGSAWEGVAHVTKEMPALWTSVDGETWDQQPIDLGLDDVTLVGIAPRADGQLLLIGRVPGMGGVFTDTAPPGSFAWTSDDASSWQAATLPVPNGTVVDSFDHGPMGYALTAEGAVWFSADGTDWTMTYDGARSVVAGDEGFVALVFPESAGTNTVVASGDGQSWLASAPIVERVFDVAALGGDWVAVGATTDPHTITVWHSADGLEWAPMLDVNDLTGPDGAKTGRGLDELAINGASLAGGAGYAFLTLTNNHCCAQMSWNYGVWGSADGMTWTPVVEGDAFVSSVASDGDATVLGGHLRRGEDAAFWIGDD